MSRFLLLVAGAIGFVPAGLWIAGVFGPPPRPGREWIGFVCAFFFATCGAFGIRRLLNPGDEIVIDGNGIKWRQWSDQLIPWDAITDIRVAVVRGRRFVCLYLREPAQYPSTRLLGRMAGVNRSLGFGDIALNVSGTDRTHDDLVEALESRWSRPAHL
jgi:hypothetical protein